MKNTIQNKNLFKDKVIILGITGALTCFKICPLITRLKQLGAKFRIVASENALNFITKTTLQTLAKTEILTTQFNPKKFDEKHKSLAEEGDVCLLAPATAQTISKIANGMADNLLTSVICAWNKPLIIAPAMNTGMWFNPSTQANISTLKKRGAIVLKANNGKMTDIDLIYEELKKVFQIQRNLKGKKILITNGNTQEQLDNGICFSQLPETNMGKLLADLAYMRGAEVTLITTKPEEIPYKQILVKSTEQMYMAVSDNIASTDYFLMAATLAPYKPQVLKSTSKENGEKSTGNLTLTLCENYDFFPSICANRKNNQIFALITEKTEYNSGLESCPKGCDFLINGALENIKGDSVLYKYGMRTILEKKATPQELATQIIDLIFTD